MNSKSISDPLASNPRNHYVRLLDVILGGPPILVHPILRRHNDPRFRTVGEFITFFAQICEVRLAHLCRTWFKQLT